MNIIFIGIILILVLAFIYYNLFSSTFVSACPTCRSYSVSSKFKNPEKAAEVFDEVVKRVDTLVSSLKKYPINLGFSSTEINNGIRNIEKRFSPNRLYEVNPLNIFGYTAYTQNKDQLMVCLRDPDGELYNINIIMFVVLHELGHMMNDDWGHDEKFWKLFKFLLVNATECGVYIPTNFALNPINYCGLDLTGNPYYQN